MTESLDLLYQNYATVHAGLKSALQERVSFVRDILPHVQAHGFSAKVLDVGCGQGRLVQQLHINGYMNAEGIDLSEEQVALAQKAGVSKVRVGDVAQLVEGTKAEWDVVVATDLLEHLTKAEVLKFVNVSCDLLKPGGVLVVRTPNAVSPFSGAYRYGDFTHQTFMTPRSFRQIVTSAGFQSSRCYPCGPIPHGVRSAVRFVGWKLISLGLQSVIMCETGEVARIVTQNFVGVARRAEVDQVVG